MRERVLGYVLRRMVPHTAGFAQAEDIAQSIKVLNAAAGFLRMQLAREMKLRSVPQLHFHYDESVVRGAHLSALIERAVAEDNQHLAAAPEDTKE